MSRQAVLSQQLAEALHHQGVYVRAESVQRAADKANIALLSAYSGDEDGPVPTDVHTYFGLSYSNFIVLHRSILQSLPEDVQHRLVAALEEADDWVAESGIETAYSYQLVAKDEHGTVVKDSVPYYDRGRTQL